MTNIEAISLIEELKAELEWDLSLEYTTALDMAIASLKRDEIGLNETIKQIHDGVYAEAYEKGRAAAIDEFAKAYEHAELIGCADCKHLDDNVHCWECIAEHLKGGRNK